MSTVVAVDTTHEFGSLALWRGGELDQELVHAPDGFGAVLYGRLAQLLERHGLRAGDVDCWAAASGPGSFTGVRIGLACVKGMAEAMARPAVAVSNLQAMASFGTAALRAPVLDARRGEIYGAVYAAGERAAVRERVMPFPEWLQTLPEGEVEFIAFDFAPFAASLAGTRWEGQPVTTIPRALAGAVARIAAQRLAAGEASDPAVLDANYVRRSDAELLWRDTR
jgi:tRNA threonylcarbamoyladenosine biosynthesis protein TsaB